MGDFNVDVLDPFDQNYSHLMVVCAPSQLANTVSVPTRVCNTSRKCIDPLLTNCAFVLNVVVSHLDFSDHALVCAQLSLSASPAHSGPVLSSKRRMDACSLQALPAALAQRKVHILTAGDANAMWIEWRDKFLAAFDNVAPRKVSQRSRKRPRCPWMTGELLHLIHCQKSLYRKVVRSNHQDVEAVRLHRLMRSRSTNLYRQLRNSHFHSCLQKYRASPKLLWSTINHITGRWKQRLPPSASLTELSQHFAVLAATNSLPATIPHGPTSADGFIQFHPVCASDVEHILLHLDGSKAGGPDGIRPCELRLAAAAVASSLTALINTSLTSGSLPNEFKTANVTPLLKPGKTDTRLPANYRTLITKAMKNRD